MRKCLLTRGLLPLALALWFAACLPGRADTNAAASPAWTNLVIGKGWGTNTQSTWAATNAPALSAESEVEAEFRRLLAADDEAQADVDRLLGEQSARRAAGAVAPDTELGPALRARMSGVRAGYEAFLARHPSHVPALLAYGSLLDDLGEETAAAIEWEKARALQPANPAIWNNLANHYAANDQEFKAFTYYERAIALATNRAPYQRNLGSAIVNLRTNAMIHYSLDEQAALARGLDLLRAAELTLTDDFTLAAEIGQVLYALRPLRAAELLAAWRRAERLAGDDIERAGVRLHVARAHLLAGEPTEARRVLSGVTNAVFLPLRRELEVELAATERKQTSGTTPPAPE